MSTREDGPPPAWAALFTAIGGRAKLAARCGVSESTVWRWSRGVFTPTKIVVDHVNALCTEHGLDPVFVGDEHGKT